jgi:hypothetical protein
MLLFGALCHVVGPEGEQGNICCCLKKKGNHQELQTDEKVGEATAAK